MYFTQITDKLKYPPMVKAKLSTLHGIVIEYVMSHYTNSRKFKVQVLDVINNLTYRVIAKDDLSGIWDEKDPLKLRQSVDDNIIRKNIGTLYLDYSDVKFDVEESASEEVPSFAELKSEVDKQYVKSVESIKSTAPIEISTANPTPKENLYIKYPTVPQFSVDDVFISGRMNGEIYTIYKSLPLIPNKQCEISATTDINIMSDVDLLNLYPNRFIRTRDECMYEAVDGVYNHPTLGNILPIVGYSQDELIDNVVRYPHIFRLSRVVDGEIVNMYSSIEIDGELYRTMDVWDDIPESAVLPRTASYIKEYVVRRYLLERDHGVIHKYPIFGSFDEHLTLIMPKEDYATLGYTDALDMAKKCVNARVSYKQTRNPILRGIGYIHG